MAVATQVEGLNRVRYSGLDFDTHFDDLRARVQVQFAQDFNDFAISSLGIMLLDLVAYGLDSLSFYLDRRASDAYLDTSRTRKAVARLSRQLGYKMGAAVSSSVDVQVAVTSPVAFSVPIQKGYQFKGPDDLVFETAELVTFDPLSGPTDFKLLPCYEGETITENFVSTGLTNQSFELRRVPPSKFVVQGTVKVFVNGAEWTESEFISFDETNQFEVGYNDDPPTVRFGDGIAGNVPAVSAPIVVIYVASRGKAGQIAAGSIVEAVTPLVVGFTTISLSITNPEPPEGGDDPEAIAKVRVLAGRVFKSRQVAVTRGDYQALAGAFADPLYGRVAAAQAISSRSAQQDVFLQNSIAEIQNLIDPVKENVNALTVDSSKLTGTIAFTNGSTLLLGSGTKFLSEIQPGLFVKKSLDGETFYVEVASVTSDTSLTFVTPYTGTTASTSGVVITSTGGVRGVLTRLLLVLTDLQTALSGIADADTSIDTAMSNLLTVLRDIKNATTEMYNDAADIVGVATQGAIDVASVPMAAANLAIGVGPARVLYVAKVSGATGAAVRVAHVSGGALAVGVVGTDITVTLAPATTATQAAAAVAANGSANALVDVYAGGAGTSNPPLLALTNLGYSGVNSLALSGIPDTTQALLQSRFDRCKTEANNIQSNVSSVQTVLDAQAIPNALEAQEQANTSGLDLTTPGSLLFTADSARDTLATTIGSTTGPTGLYLSMDNIDAAVAPLDSTLVVGNADTVGTQLDAIYKHVDALLADDCKSNLVTVPILTHDAAGFYTGPTIGLTQALQAYLDARKEVTQTVKVTSGERYLVRPVILLRAGVRLGYSLSVTKTSIETAVDAILRDRDFGVSLYTSDFCPIIDELVSGLSFLNVTISGYNDVDGVLQTTKNDANGNLIIEGFEVISKEQRLTLPSIAVTTELVQTNN